MAVQKLKQFHPSAKPSKHHDQVYRDLVESSQALIWSLDHVGRWTFVNAAAKQLLGYEPDEMLGKSYTRFITPEQVQQSIQIFDRMAAGENHLQYETAFRHKSGKTVYLNVNLLVARSSTGQMLSASGTATDITQRKQTEAALHQSEARFQRLSTSVPGVIYQFLLQADGTSSFPFISSSCYELFGLEATAIEADASLLESMIHPDDRSNFEQSIYRSTQTLEPWQWEGRFVLASGEHKWVQGASRPEQYENGDILWDGLLMDVTRLKQTEAALQTAYDELEKRVEQRTTLLAAANRALREEKARYRAFVEQASEGIFLVDVDSKHILETNEAYQQLLGYTAEEAAQLTVYDLATGTPEAIDHRLQSILASRQHHITETQHRCKDGTWIDVEVSIKLIRLGGKDVCYCVVRDIRDRKRLEAERKQTEQTLRASEKALRTIFNGVYDALFVHTTDGTILDVNEQMLDMFEVTREQVPQFSLAADYFSPDNPLEELPQMWADVMAGKNQFFEWTARRPNDGSVFDVEVFLRKLDLGDRSVILANVRDVTQRKAAEAALRESEAKEREKSKQLEQTLLELQQAQAQLIQSEKMSSLGQLVAGVAHEINNPVNFIYGNLTHAAEYTKDLLRLLQLYQQHYPQPVPAIQDEIDLMDLEFLIGDLPKLLTSMRVGADRIQKIVRSLRTFSRMDEAEVKPVSLHDGIDSTLMILQNRLKAKPDYPAVQVVKTYGQLPPVECHAGQMNQVFMNILSNAIDALEEATDQGRWLSSGAHHSAIGGNLPTIHIHTELREDDRVVIRIADNGTGMSETVRQRLFDPFFTTKPVGKGTGMGMSISYQIVTERHKGTLQCFSTPGEGAEFVIIIPVRQVKQPRVKEQTDA